MADFNLRFVGLSCVDARRRLDGPRSVRRLPSALGATATATPASGGGLAAAPPNRQGTAGRSSSQCQDDLLRQPQPLRRVRRQDERSYAAPHPICAARAATHTDR
jgi:hypothetical protein